MAVSHKGEGNMLAWANYNGFHVASVISDPPSPQGLMETEAERWEPSPPTWSHPTRNKVCVRDKEAAVTVWRWRGAEHCALANHQGQNIGLRVITTRVRWWGQRWSLCRCLERLGKLISGNNRMLMSFNVSCVHWRQHLQVKKNDFQKRFSSVPRKDLSYAGKVIFKFCAAIHYHFPELWTPARLKTQSEHLFDPSAALSWNPANRQCCGKIARKVTISLFRAHSERWAFLILTTEIKQLVCDTYVYPFFFF